MDTPGYYRVNLAQLDQQVQPEQQVPLGHPDHPDLQELADPLVLLGLQDPLVYLDLQGLLDLPEYLVLLVRLDLLVAPQIFSITEQTPL
jgi:hypothetical protein